jgi:hypothetical protein
MTPRMTESVTTVSLSIDDSITTNSESQQIQNDEIDIINHNLDKNSSSSNLRVADSKTCDDSLTPFFKKSLVQQTKEISTEENRARIDNIVTSKEKHEKNINNEVSPLMTLSQDSSQAFATQENKKRRISSHDSYTSGIELSLSAHDLKQRSKGFFKREGMFNTQHLLRQQAERQSKIIIIPANHPLKISWDFLTVVLTFVSAYATHGSIRDRNYNMNPFVIFTQIWLLVDLLLNFFTQHKSSDGKVFRDPKLVWARYLTTWFAIDALSLIPWENLYVKPIIEMQNKRGFFKKSFFRTRAVIRVTRFLRGKHFRYFGKVVNRTQHLGVGAQRLLGLLIKYLPKYILFYKNMRGVLAVRTLRQIHMIRKVLKQVSSSPSLNQANSTSEEGANSLTESLG